MKSNTPKRLANTHRIEGFSDAVFAIAITILVLEFHIPEHEPGHLLQALLDQWSSLLAYVFSFTYIGIVWLNHHSLFTHLKYVDRRFEWINLGILITTCLLAYPTAVLAEAFRGSDVHDQGVAVAFYAVSAGFLSASWLPVPLYLERHPELLESDTKAMYFPMQNTRPRLGVILYAIAATVGYFQPAVGLGIFAFMVLYHGLTSEGVEQAPLLNRLFRE